MLIFLITMLGFVPFAFDSDKPQFRCQVTGLLLLTSVNFRWVITQRLPSVPYLTSLDKYAIGSLLYLVLFCVWHSIIGSNIITSDGKQKEDIDHYVLMSKSIKKFQSEGLKDAADQTKKRNKLNNKEIETTLTIDEQNDYEILKKCVKKELNTNKNVTKVSNSNPNLSRSNRLISQPSTNDPSLLITTA
ncbi:gamma aminobutyric acid receptor subunit [Brachionus plicatilis]|uniref:Gamma aminobutyric acid receptor subunit n=1 Tax=Brachionus plicatilis TaxID=10195 RepID=A0A3M7QDW7_BRAPC|nr:gamma aminobutyric acid receptor subunit [Brachionus plicatilis]